ncbi:hypothetical protein, partial [Okeania sp.]|uniref:hypothetical protein n=1 Tax=Okeania sp. TaxID=3100323 RepID=UPI002B4AB8AD
KKVSVKKAKTKPVINSTVPYLDISLARVDNQQRSKLNAFFGKGRWNRKREVGEWGRWCIMGVFLYFFLYSISGNYDS